MDTNQWEELPNDRAIAKVSQALREGQKDIRKSLERRMSEENEIDTHKLTTKLSSDRSNDTYISTISESSTVRYSQNLHEVPKVIRRFDMKGESMETTEIKVIEGAARIPLGRAKSPNLSSESLCNFTTSKEIAGSPIRMPRKNRMKTDVIEVTGDENKDIHSSELLPSDDFQLENQVLKSPIKSELSNRSFESSLAYAEAIPAEKEDETMDLVESEEIQFIKQIFSED